MNPLLAKVFGLKVSIEQKQGSNCLEAWPELEVAVSHHRYCKQSHNQQCIGGGSCE